MKMIESLAQYWQPSPGTSFPSSQPSPPSTMPSPQTGSTPPVLLLDSLVSNPLLSLPVIDASAVENGPVSEDVAFSAVLLGPYVPPSPSEPPDGPASVLLESTATPLSVVSLSASSLAQLAHQTTINSKQHPFGYLLKQGNAMALILLFDTVNMQISPALYIVKKRPCRVNVLGQPSGAEYGLP